MPSLHNAFAMLILLVAWPVAGRLQRAFLVGFALWMFAGSIYLDHHWVLDALAGWSLSALAVVAARLATGAPRHPRREAATAT